LGDRLGAGGAGHATPTKPMRVSGHSCSANAQHDVPLPPGISRHNLAFRTSTRHNIGMSMSESFAATAVQTLPVFALAAIIEYRSSARVGYGAVAVALFARGHRKHAAEPILGRRHRWEVYLGWLTSWVWTVVLLSTVVAEWICLNRLQGSDISAGGTRFVAATMVSAMALIVLYPIMATFLESYRRFMGEHLISLGYGARTALPLEGPAEERTVVDGDQEDFTPTDAVG
jgi:hypothetical protein